MTDDDKKLLYHYADLRTQEKTLKEELEELKPLALQAVLNKQQEDGEDLPIEIEGRGKFHVEMQKEWHFSEKVQLLEQELKELKATEQAKKIATFVEKPILKFNTIKI